MNSFTGSSNSRFSRYSISSSLSAFAGSEKWPSHAVAIFGEASHRGARPSSYRQSRRDFVTGSSNAKWSSNFLGTVWENIFAAACSPFYSDFRYRVPDSVAACGERSEPWVHDPLLNLIIET